MRPLKQFGFPVIDALGPVPYCQLNAMLDAAYPRGALNYWKSNFLAQLSDDAIEKMIECFARCPTPMGQLLLEHVHGAATRIGVSDTAFPHRANGYNFLVLSQCHAETKREAEIQPHGMADNLRREPISGVAGASGRCHSTRLLTPTPRRKRVRPAKLTVPNRVWRDC